MRQNTDMGGINLVIFDADEDTESRRAELLAIKEEFGVEFELFLLPNNKDVGALEDLLESKSHLISFESQDYGMTEIYNHISSLEGLKYLGISIEDGIEYTYEDESESEESYVFTKEDFVTYDEYVAFNNIDATSEEDDPFVYYEIDTKNDIAILTLDSCINNEEYKDCLNKMFSEIKENGIHNVAVDLRNNHGGNSSVANEFLKYINIDTYKTWGFVWRLGIFQIKSDTATLENNPSH